MKAILEFNLPEDSHEYSLCNQASELYSVITYMNERLRNALKYEELPKEVHEKIEKIYQEFNQDLIDYNILFE